MQFGTDLHTISVFFLDFFKWPQGFLQVSWADELTLACFSSKIERPDFHRIDAHIKKTASETDRIIQEAVQILIVVSCCRRLNTEVFGCTDFGTSNVTVSRAGVVDGNIFSNSTP